MLITITTGHTDIFILRGGWFSEFGELGNIPNSLLRNNGNGTFSDLTEAAGLLSSHPTQTAVWWDYNNDGWLDLFIGNETLNDNEKNPANCTVIIAMEHLPNAQSLSGLM